MDDIPDNLTTDMLYTPQTQLPNDATLYALLDLMHTEWVRTDITTGDGLVAWACGRLEVDATTVTYKSLQEQADKRMLQLVQLDRMFKNRTELLSGDALIMEKIARIAHVIRQAKVIVESAASLFYHLDSSREMLLPKEWKIENIFCNGADDKCTSFQSLLLYVLQQLSTAEYRRLNGDCYVQELTPSGERTHAWKKTKEELGDFVYRVTQKESNRDQWMNMTNPPDNGQRVIKHIKEACNVEFPDLIVNRYLFSYDNGLYNVESDMFYPFDAQADWPAMAKEITIFRRENDWGDSYTAVPPTATDVAVKYLNQPFRFDITPDTEETFNPDDIQLKELDKILDAQKLDEGTKRWVLLMLCRLFFPVGFDAWQVMLFIKGIAGSGKSTLAKFIREYYDASMITTLASNLEGKFGLSSIYKGLICVCAEVRADFGLDQGTWQSAVSGEEVSVMEKFKTAFAYKWDTPMFFLGNELPSYPNSSGSVDRRLFMIEFGYIISSSDPNLYKSMVRNMDNFQRKGVSLYHAARREFGNKDIWDIPQLPQQVMDFKATMRKAVDCLDSFLGDKTRFQLDPSAFMKLADFRDMYMAYRKEQGHPPQKWGKDVYSQGFQLHGILEKPDPETRTYGGNTSSEYWIIGIDLIPAN